MKKLFSKNTSYQEKERTPSVCPAMQYFHLQRHKKIRSRVRGIDRSGSKVKCLGLNFFYSRSTVKGNPSRSRVERSGSLLNI